jgi:putative membrane protein
MKTADRTSLMRTSLLCALIVPLLACAPNNDAPDNREATDTASAEPATTGAAAGTQDMASDTGQTATAQDPGMSQDPATSGMAPGANAGSDMAMDPAAAEEVRKASEPAAAKDFYRMALSSGVGEVDLSQHAAANAGSPQVREFAQMLVKDHTAVNEKLRSASGIKDAAPPPKTKAEADMVKQQKGQAYDRAFLDHMAKGHAKSIALYENASKNGPDEKARQLAQQTLPSLRTHAQRVQSLQGAVGTAAP